MKLKLRLQALARDYFKQTEYSSRVVDTQNSYIITEKDKQEMIEYYESECRKTSCLYFLNSLGESLVCLLIILGISIIFYHLFNSTNLILSLIIALLPIFIVSRFFNQITWILCKRKIEYERLVKTLKDVK